jgi:hypothetical protein
MSGQCKCGSRAINDDPDRLLCDTCLRDAEIERLREQLREQTKSFCTHCGRLFPKGRDGIAAFREHIAECNEHPLHPMAKQLDECRRLLRDVSVVEEKGVRGDIYIHVTQQWLREAARAAGGEE